MSEQITHIHTRLMEHHDIPQLLALFQASFGHPLNPELVNWKYYQNPAGASIPVVAEDRDKLVGFYGLVPARFHHPNGEELLTFQETDLMVHPEYRGMNLFAKLNTMAYAVAPERGGYCTFGFPNQVSTPVGMKKLGWLPLIQVPIWTLYLSVSSERVALLNKLGKALGDLPGKALAQWMRLGTEPILRGRLTGLKPEDIDLEFLARPEATPEKYTQLKNDRFFQWRYLKNPSENYEYLTIPRESGLRDILVWRTRKRGKQHEALILDVFTESDLYLKHLLWGVVQAALKERVSTVRAWALPGSRLANVFRASGFLPRGGPTMMVRPCEPENDLARLTNAKLWEVTLGDSDTA